MPLLDHMPETASPVSVSQAGLIRLSGPARAIALDVLRVNSLQTGAYVSHFRGSGMEFDESRPYQPGDDPRGALRQRIAEARFPVLAANLIDDTTGRRVDWENVHSSAEIDVHGVRVGIIGVMTSEALETTIAANTPGLSIAPLAEIMGRVPWASEVFNCNAPDTGNMELLHLFATPEQRERWLLPLLNGALS